MSERRKTKRLHSKIRALFVLGAACWMAPLAMAETPRYLDYCCSEITPPPANYGRGGLRGVIVDPDSQNPACYKTISSALKKVVTNGTIWVKPNNQKTLIESLVIRKGVKIRAYDPSEVADMVKNRKGGVNSSCRPTASTDNFAEINTKNRIRKLKNDLKEEKDRDEIKRIQEVIAALEEEMGDIEYTTLYRLQPIAGQNCVKVSLKSWKSTVEISNAHFIPPPQGEYRSIDCIENFVGNVKVTGSLFEGQTFGANDYRAITLHDGSATISGNRISNLKVGVFASHAPKIHNSQVSSTLKNRKIVIHNNTILRAKQNAIEIVAPIHTLILENVIQFAGGGGFFGRSGGRGELKAGITTYGRGPICGNLIQSNQYGIVHYGAGTIQDNSIIENDTGVSLRSANQKIQIFDNVIAGNEKVGLAAPRGSIQDREVRIQNTRYGAEEEEELFDEDRGDSRFFTGNQFCNRKNVYSMRELPHGARRANSFKGRRGYTKRCPIPENETCSIKYSW